MALIKVCGITRLSDAEFCASTGVDFIGFIFVEKSPRKILPEECKIIISNLKNKIFKVGVFADSSSQDIKKIVELCGLDYVQLHGNENPLEFKNFQYPIIKAFKTEKNIFSEIYKWKNIAKFLLFDNISGGTGLTFDWAIINDAKKEGKLEGFSFFIAGGLGPHNVKDVLKLSPDGIDFNSKLEIAPGIKDHKKIQKIVEIVRGSK